MLVSFLLVATASFQLPHFAHANGNMLRSSESSEHSSGNDGLDLLLVRQLTNSETPVLQFVGNNGSPSGAFPLQQCQGDWYVQHRNKTVSRLLS